MGLDFKKGAMIAVGVGVGAVAAKMIDEKMLANMTSLNPKIKAFLFVAGGTFLAITQKNDLIRSAGDGIIAYGALKLYEQFAGQAAPPPAIPGVGYGENVSDNQFLQGVYSSLQVLNGSEYGAPVSGGEEGVQGNLPALNGGNNSYAAGPYDQYN